MERVAVIDFETTGLSPTQGDRATEIAAVILEGGRVVDRYQSLMNAGVRVPAHIEALTGISNAMLREAPPASDVTNTYILDKDGDGTKLTLQMDAVLTPPGMPNMPGMEDMMKKQMVAGLETTLQAMKKLIEA